MAKKLVKYFVVDAFAESAFKGNPAAVCLLEEDRDEEWLQSLASEFNISQTCYLTRITESDTLNPQFRLRWFTPVAEVELCGHATLAAAHSLFSSGLVVSNIIEFSTPSGILTATKVPEAKNTKVLGAQSGQAEKESFFIQLDLPSIRSTGYSSAEVLPISAALNHASLVDIKRTISDNLIILLPSAKSVLEYQPRFDDIQKCPGKGVIITGDAPSESGFDFYSRYFCPKLGINEDPVCGSAHCALAVYWSEKLGKSDFVAYAASPRGGMVKIRLDKQNQRVFLQGKALTIMEGSVLV